MIKKEDKKLAREMLKNFKETGTIEKYTNASILHDIALDDLVEKDARKFCVEFNCVFEKETEEYKPFDNKRRFSYRSMARVFDNKSNKSMSTYDMAEIKYFVRMMFFALNNPSTAWIDCEILCPLLEYMASRCEDNKALDELTKLPFRTIETKRLEQKKFAWFN